MLKTKIIAFLALAFISVSFSQNEIPLQESIPGLSKEEYTIKIAPLLSQKNKIHTRLKAKLSGLDEMAEQDFKSITEDLLDEYEEKFEDLEISENEYTRKRTQLEIILAKTKAYSKMTSDLNREFKKNFRPFKNMDKLEKRLYSNARIMKRLEDGKEILEKTGEE